MTVAMKKQIETLVAKMKPGERVKLADSLYASVLNAYLSSVNRAWNEGDSIADWMITKLGQGKAFRRNEVHAEFVAD